MVSKVFAPKLSDALRMLVTSNIDSMPDSHIPDWMRNDPIQIKRSAKSPLTINDVLDLHNLLGSDSSSFFSEVNRS